MNTQRSAFTLVELLVVIAIIGILIGLLLPAVQSVREAARRMQCSNNVRQLALAAHNYAALNKGAFPYAGGARKYNVSPIPGAGNYGFFVTILPFVEQQGIYDRIDWTIPCQNVDKNLAKTPISTYTCPSFEWDILRTERYYGALTCYVGIHGVQRTAEDNNNLENWEEKYAITPSSDTITCSGGGYCSGTLANNGMMLWNKVVRESSVTDGLSNTYYIGDYVGQFITGKFTLEQDTTVPYYMRPWILGSNTNSNLGLYVSKGVTAGPNGKTGESLLFNVTSLGSHHPGGISLARADGSTSFVSDNVNLKVYKAMCTRNGQEIPPQEE